MITLSDDEAALWIERVMPIQEDFAERMNQLGLEGEEILETVRRLAERY